MDIPSFVRNILQSFSKSDVVEKINNIASKLLKIVRPSFEIMIEELDEAQYKSNYAKQVAKDFALALPTNLRSEKRPVTTFMPKALANAATLLDQLLQYVGSSMPTNLHIEGITYQKATVIRLIDLLDFFVDYSIRHMAYLTASETNIEDYGRPDGLASTPAEFKYLEANRGTWIKMLSILQGDPKLVLKQVETIPEVFLGDLDVGSVPALAGAAADPLHLGAIPIVSNAFRWVGIRYVHYEVERYERAMKEKRVIELRLESRRQRLSGNQDAAGEAVVKNYENELVRIRQKIASMEESMRGKV